MVILDIIPLTHLPRNQAGVVSYYHTDHLPRGTIIQTLFNNRIIKGVVVASDDLKNRKALLKKQATFTLKPILKILHKEPQVTSYTLQVAREISEYYYSPLGLSLRAVIAHPEETNYKKYIAPGTARIVEALYDYLPEIDELRALSSKLQIRVVDMRREIRDANYSIFSRDLKEALQVAQENKQRVIIFIPRRGYANLISCKTCGHTFKCQNCSASLVLHELQVPSSKFQEVLKCHHCGYQEPRPKHCPNCKGYALKSYGIGIDKVDAELKKFFSYQNLATPTITMLTSESKKLPESWDILLTTQALFKFKSLIKVEYLGIINADALMHIPDYRSEEQLFRQTYLLATLAHQTFIQTYNPDDPALVSVAANDAKGFWEKELIYRKQFNYPPFMQLVKITLRDRNRETIQRNATTFAKQIGGTAYPALIERERGYFVWNILLKFKKDVDITKRNAILNQVPPDWSIDVDPISIV